MNAFEIHGGRSLKGTITPQGAKNEALQVLCAALLTDEQVTLTNVPDIVDVNTLIELLEDMGVKIGRPTPNTITLQAANISPEYFITQAFKKKSGKLRGTVMLAGPLLARFRKAFIPQPGGDKIGRRRLDTHFLGFEKLGARFNFDNHESFYTAEADNLKGTYILLDEPSVTGTANVIMTAVMAKGTTTIYNAACEPYLQQLTAMLIRMGAKITGSGSNLLVIEGVEYLGGTEHRMLPDMIEIGSFIGLAAMTQSEITIKNCINSQKYLIIFRPPSLTQ